MKYFALLLRALSLHADKTLDIYFIDVGAGALR